MSSAWKNLIPKRKYRERRQLHARRHLGMLEKKKDYIKRAKDYHGKEKQMEKLREQVINKNPDEFYHKMINAKMIKGEHTIKGTTGEDDYKKNMKLLDYTRMVEANRAEKLQSQLHLIDVEKPNNHTFFVSNKKEIKRKVKDIKKKEEELLERKEEKLAERADNIEDLEEYFSNINQQKKKSYHNAAKSMKRHNVLSQMRNALEMDQKLKGKGKRRKVIDKTTGKEHFEWFTERKS
mmetsp:Transcript_22639/g.20116  ORF Transcript_22639/g.20116 Transcript_22639/m.20116 type:complete len:236 (+) Transcript_22639:29-736(+)